MCSKFFHWQINKTFYPLFLICAECCYLFYRRHNVSKTNIILFAGRTQYTIALVGSFVRQAQNAEFRKPSITQLPNLLHCRVIDIAEFNKVGKQTVRSLEITQMTNAIHKNIDKLPFFCDKFFPSQTDEIYCLKVLKAKLLPP